MFHDIAEGPANRRSVREFSFLHDVFAVPTSNQLGANAVVWVEPADAPRLDGWIVNPEREQKTAVG
jgi:hypothetical protein